VEPGWSRPGWYEEPVAACKKMVLQLAMQDIGQLTYFERRLAAAAGQRPGRPVRCDEAGRGGVSRG